MPTRTHYPPGTTPPGPFPQDLTLQDIYGADIPGLGLGLYRSGLGAYPGGGRGGGGSAFDQGELDAIGAGADLEALRGAAQDFRNRGSSRRINETGLAGANAAQGALAQAGLDPGSSLAAAYMVAQRQGAALGAAVSDEGERQIQAERDRAALLGQTAQLSQQREDSRFAQQAQRENLRYENTRLRLAWEQQRFAQAIAEQQLYLQQFASPIWRDLAGNQLGR